MTDNDITDLSRRKLLGSISAVGATTVGAGLGTSAYFNDEEEFTNNSFTAGELDLKVDYRNLYWGPATGPYSSEGRPHVDSVETPSDADDIEQPLVNLEDVKPGDKGCLEVGLELVDNPGFICISGSLEESENGMNDPESEVDDTAKEGELGEHIQATLFHDTNGDSVDEDDCHPDDEDIVLAEGSLVEVFKLLDDGVPLIDSEDACVDGGERHTVVLHWHLPADTGNVVQSDSATFDLAFYTEQCRHNDLASFDDHPCASCFQTDLVVGDVIHDFDEEGKYGDRKISHRWGSTADYSSHSNGTTGAAGVTIDDDISWNNGQAEVTITVDASEFDGDQIAFASYYAKCPPQWKGDESMKYQVLIDSETIDVSADGQTTLSVEIPERQV
jgi:predicted ribosomally synthesized peptide with SipW-like signal peptide